MTRPRTLIVGHGGRESALAAKMATSSEVHAFMGHSNPSLVECGVRSGGGHGLGDVCDPKAVADFATERRVDLAMVSADAPLEAGVVDALLARGIPTVGPTRGGAEIEWNKAFARKVLDEVAPEAAPRVRVVTEPASVRAAIDAFGEAPVVVKPSGLTGGKGVKVMGPHLDSHLEAARYAEELLATDAGGDSVLIEERVQGAEFTIQAISDGRTVIFPPSTYDFPYRFDGDEGPGTGGMGSLSVGADTLPFMSLDHYREACSIVQAVIDRLADMGRRFTGIMNSGFFATAEGVKVIEFNARFGDPEAMNILSLFDGDWTHVMERICSGTLTEADVPLRREEASVVLYLVSPDYALNSGRAYEFHLDRQAIGEAGCEVFFASSVEVSANLYRTVGTSRAVAISTTADSLEVARRRVVKCAEGVDVLQWRRDVGQLAYLESLRDLVEGDHRR